MNVKNNEAMTNAWDSGELGREEEFVRRVSPETQIRIEEKLAMQMISIRLPVELITQLKFIATVNEVGYQPLIRDVLTRFSRSEIISIATGMAQHQMAQTGLEESESPAAKFFPEKKAAVA